MKIIEINWFGPFTHNQVVDMNNDCDYGIYQVYGNHRIYGENVLLYVGKAKDQTFGVRIPQHEDWFGFEENQQSFFIGKIGADKNTTLHDWSEQIDYAETRIIGHCQPGWNSSGLKSFKMNFSFEEAVILNAGIKKHLPSIIYDVFLKNSTLRKNNWEAFSKKSILQ